METTGTKIGVCDVHKWGLRDESPREVYYCSLCDAWICQQCDGNLPLRAIAAVRRKKAELFGLKKTA